MPRSSYTRRDTDSPEAPMMHSGCPDCRTENQTTRHIHFLQLARALGFEACEEHVYQELLLRLKNDRDRAQHYTADIVMWIKDEVKTWSGFADPETGAKLPWWEARRQGMALAYESHAERERRMQSQTPFREPGEDEMDDVTRTAQDRVPF